MATQLNRAQLEAARSIVNHPLVIEILDDMEYREINAAINAKPTDTNTVAAHLAEARAIRNFRSRLLFIVADGDETLKREKAEK